MIFFGFCRFLDEKFSLVIVRDVRIDKIKHKLINKSCW